MSMILNGVNGITLPDNTTITTAPNMTDLTGAFTFSTSPKHLNYFTGTNNGYLSIKIGGLVSATTSIVNQGYMRVVITQDDRDLNSNTNPALYEFVFKGNMQSGVWYNPQAVVVGASTNQPLVNVRFTRTATDAYIEIGDSSSVWTHATVNVYNVTSTIIPSYTPTYSTSIQTSLKGTSTDFLVVAGMTVAKLATAQNIALSGDVSGSASFDGSAGANITATLANSGVSSGSYGSSTNIPVISIDSKGRITSASNQAVSIPSGSLTFTGDVTGSGNTGSSTSLTLANSGVAAGSYTKVTVDSKGRVTTGGSLTSSDIQSALGGVSAATTNYVDSAIAGLINSAPGALDTLNELATALGNDASFSTTITNSLSLKAPLSNPTFTGTVSGITASMVGAMSTSHSANSITGLGASTTSLTSGGTGTQGTSTVVARQDHTHTLPAYPTTLPASDVYAWAKASTKPSYAYSELTGLPTIPTNTNQLTNGSGYITASASITGSSASCTGNSATATSLAGGSAGTVPYQTASGSTSMLAAGTSGYFLKCNGTSAPSWASPAEVISLADLNNVAISSPASSQILSYNGTNWVNSAITSSQVTSALGYTPANSSNFSTSSNVTFNTVYAYNFYSLSDQNLKTNITSIENAVDIINSLNAVEFDWKETGKHESGLIAQEVEKILPHLVNDNGDYKTVNYIGIISYLIGAVKELSAEINLIKGV